MKLNRPLEQIFSAKSNVSVLRTLNERSNGVSGREISRLTSLSLRTVQLTLAHLVRTGIAKIFVGNKEHLYVLNRENYFAKSLIEEIFKAEDNFRKSIYSEIKKAIGKDAISVLLFGSAARGNDTIESDLDICIVYSANKKNIEEKISLLRSKLYQSHNITLAPFYTTLTKFRELSRNKRQPIAQIVKEGKIICGKKINELLNG